MRSIVALLSTSLLFGAEALAAEPSASELCALALDNRPLDQLQARAGCEIVQARKLPAGTAVAQAVILRVPLATGTVDVLLLEAGRGSERTWVDFGVVAGETRARGPGSDFELTERGALERFEVKTSRGGPVLELARSSTRTMGDRKGTSTVTREELVVCKPAREPICLRLPTRVALTVQGEGDPDLKPYAWTRAVSLDARGDLVIGALDGTGELSPFDPGEGKHTFSSLADRAFVRMYPVKADVHPSATEDPPLDLP